MKQQKLSLCIDQKWIEDLKQKVQFELSSLAQENVKLHAEVHVLEKCLTPLLETKRQFPFQNDDVDVDNILVNHADIENMKQIINGIGNFYWT